MSIGAANPCPDASRRTVDGPLQDHPVCGEPWPSANSSHVTSCGAETAFNDVKPAFVSRRIGMEGASRAGRRQELSNPNSHSYWTDLSSNYPALQDN